MLFPRGSHRAVTRHDVTYERECVSKWVLLTDRQTDSVPSHKIDRSICVVDQSKYVPACDKATSKAPMKMVSLVLGATRPFKVILSSGKTGA